MKKNFNLVEMIEGENGGLVFGREIDSTNYQKEAVRLRDYWLKKGIQTIIVQN